MMTWFKRRRTRRRAMGGAAVGVAVATAFVAQMSMVSNASWNDSEWVNAAPVGTVDCADPAGAFATRGEGRALSGSLLGIDLDALAEVQGVEVTNNGSRSVASGGAPALGLADAYTDPLNVELVNALPLALSGVLQLNADTDAGVVNQFGQAKSTGESFGASGYVGNDGGIQLHDDPADYPALGSIDLKGLLNSVGLKLGDLVSGVADLDLEIGAVAGQVSVDGCAETWGQDTTQSVRREYLVSSINTNINSPAVGALVSGVEETVTQLEQTVNSLTSNQGVLDSILGGVTGLLNGLISNPILSLGSIDLSLTATVDTRALRGLLTETISDMGGILAINLNTGLISVNTAALLGAAYPSEYSNGLNGLPPNSDLLGSKEVTTALTQALNNALNDWLTRVTTSLYDTIDGIQLNVKVLVDLKVEVCLLGCTSVNIGEIGAEVSGTLKELLAGEAQTTPITNINLGLVGAILEPIVKPLVNLLLSGLVQGLGGIVGNAVETVVGLLRILPSTVQGLVDPILLIVTNVYTELYLSGIVQLVVNAQNAAPDEPQDWAGATAGSIPNGQFEVAAIRVGVLNLANSLGVRLYLGRASGGIHCSAVEASQSASPCANY